MLSDLEKLKKGDKDIFFLGQWRIYNLYLIYDKENGECYFYTSAGRKKYWINNLDVISIITDTCIDVITKAALKFSKTYDKIEYLGKWKSHEIWTIWQTEVPEKQQNFLLFDGRQFRISNSEKETVQLKNYFKNYKYGTNYSVPV